MPGGVDVIDLAEVGQNLGGPGLLDVLGPAAQIGGILAGGEPAVEPEHAQIASGTRIRRAFYNNATTAASRKVGNEMA